MKKMFNNPFADYLVSVVAIGGGIVGLKVLVNGLAANSDNQLLAAVRNTLMLM